MNLSHNLFTVCWYHFIGSDRAENEVAADFEILSHKFQKQREQLLPSKTVDCIKSYHPASILSSRDMMILDWNTIHVPGIGLMNNQNGNKNLCFMNAVLQCLSYTPALTQWLLHEQDKLTNCM